MKSKGVFLTRLIPLVFLLAFASEDEFHNKIQEKLNGYYSRNIPVKLNFFFNQSQYVPGDTIFFRALFVTAAGYQTLPGRQIVNVDLTDHKGVIVHRQKILLTNGWGKNQILVPRDLAPGAYTLVGYSNWMKNHDHRLFSYNRLLISGTKQLAVDVEQPLHFFAEGGVLTKGVNNKIIAFGSPDEKITITDTQNRPVSTIALDRFGLGIFYLTPSENESYKGVSGSKQVELPQPMTSPVSMVVTPSLSGSPLKIALEKSDEADADQIFHLTIVDHHNLYYSGKFSFGDRRNAVINVPYEKLAPGLSLITLFRDDGTELLNRIIFIPRINAAGVRIDVAKKLFEPREQVVVDLQLVNSKGEPVAGNISVTVQDSTLMPYKPKESITQKLVLSDLPHSALSHPSISEMDDYTLNNFLITQEWYRFAWKDVMNDKTFNSHQFSSYLRLAGRARLPQGKSFGDSTRITFFLQQDANTYQTYVDSAGNFNFPLAFDFDNTEVYYRIETKGRLQKGALIEPQVSFNHAFTLPAAKESSGASPLGVFTVNRFLIDHAYKPTLDLKNYTRQNKESVDNSLSEYFVADQEVKLDDYLLFPTMEETFREIVPAVAHRTIDRRSAIRVVLPDEKRWGTENPLFIIDGVITDDIDYLMSLKPKDVSVIKIINSRKNKAVLGPIAGSGVLIIETTIPNNSRSVPRATTMFFATGISKPLPFFISAEKNFRPRVPVLKSCLYWNPDVKTDANGKATLSFYTVDNIGTFRIIVDGLTEKGEPVSGVQTVVVKGLTAH